jgi:hypothetical protein
MSFVNVGAFATSAPAAADVTTSDAVSTQTPTAMFRACPDASPVMFALPFKFYRTVTLT